MDMIVHEDVGMQCQAVALPVPLQAMQVGGIVGHVVKQRRPPVAVGDDMIERARKLDARFADHAGEPYAPRLNKSILMPDPIIPTRVLYPPNRTIA